MQKKSFLKLYNADFPDKAVSSTIAEISYSDKSKILIVIFHNGKKYEYTNVPITLFERALKAEYIGKFLIAEVFGSLFGLISSVIFLKK